MKQLSPSRTRGAARIRRLRRGAQRWVQDVGLSPEPTWRVAMLTLTTESDDPYAAWGLAQRFWQRVRQTHIGTRYFCWLEVQKRGAIHYHALWLNPPHRLRADVVHQVERWWGAGRTQVRFRDAEWFERSGASYLLSYAKKYGRKKYQQEYEDLPRGIRTFVCQRLEIQGEILDEHRDRDIYAYHPGRTRDGDYYDEMLELAGFIRHTVPPGGYCSAVDHRRPRRRAAPARRAPPRPATAPGGRGT